MLSSQRPQQLVFDLLSETCKYKFQADRLLMQHPQLGASAFHSIYMTEKDNTTDCPCISITVIVSTLVHNKHHWKGEQHWRLHLGKSIARNDFAEQDELLNALLWHGLNADPGRYR